MYRKIVQIHFLIVIFCTTISFSQQRHIPNVFIDYPYIDLNYIKEQIPIVNYVRDQKEADIHVLFTSQKTAAGGTYFTIYFIGQNNFTNLKDTVKYLTNQNDTEDISRKKMVKALELGFFEYLVKSGLSDKINISYTEPQKKVNQKDDWDYWLFRTSLNGNFNGQANQKAMYLNGSFFADRATEDSKININISSSYNENRYTYNSGTETTEILNLSRAQSFSTYIVKSIDSNWSWGIWGGIVSSTYANINISAYVAPGIEYNIFPYSVSNERQFRIDYQVKHIYNKYIQETILFKKEEDLWSNSLNLTLSLIRPWGNMSINASGSNYLNDFNLFDLGVSSSVSMELFNGLSINLNVGYSKIQDQISLPLASETLENLLTQNVQIQTNFSYWGGFGISYSFGSIYNNVVNPRFGGG
ncbi:MAG: hypothetical protein ACYC6P_13285 [Ignavibacteriaceae bacterium]